MPITSGLNSPHRRNAAPEAAQLAFRFLTTVDVEGFSRHPAAGQARIQDDLEHVMSAAAASAKLDRRRWYRQPSGDGEMAVLPANTDGLRLVADYPRQLAQVLAETNKARDPGTRLRVRVAIHHGTVSPGRFGPIGMAPIVISRLVDSAVLRHQLKQQGHLDLVLIVSATVFDEVVQTRFHGLDPDTFNRVAIKVKGTTYIGYIHHDGSLYHFPVTVGGAAAASDEPLAPAMSGSLAS